MFNTPLNCCALKTDASEPLDCLDYLAVKERMTKCSSKTALIIKREAIWKVSLKKFHNEIFE